MPDPLPVPDVIVSGAVARKRPLAVVATTHTVGWAWSSGTSGSRIVVLKRPFLSTLTRARTLCGSTRPLRWLGEAVIVINTVSPAGHDEPLTVTESPIAADATESTINGLPGVGLAGLVAVGAGCGGTRVDCGS